MVHNILCSRIGKVRSILWNLMEYPETSRTAQVCFLPSSTIIIITIVITIFITIIIIITDNPETLRTAWGGFHPSPSPRFGEITKKSTIVQKWMILITMYDWCSLKDKVSVWYGWIYSYILLAAGELSSSNTLKAAHSRNLLLLFQLKNIRFWKLEKGVESDNYT